MGTRWGISRSTAMLHGLLYLAPAPLTAVEMCEHLQLARRILEERRRRETAGAVSAVQDCLVAAQHGVSGSGCGQHSLAEWLRTHADTMGRKYASELSRRA